MDYRDPDRSGQGGGRWLTVTNAAAVLAIVVGTFQVLSYAIGSPLLNTISHTFAISPAPSPFASFTRQRGPEGVGSLFGCEDQARKIVPHTWSYVVRNRIPGPHRRIVTMITFFLLLSMLDSDESRHRFERMARYYFCDGGPIGKAAGCPTDLRAVHFFVPDRNLQPHDLSIACLK